MSLFRSMGLSASGMAVERYRMDVTSGNLASDGVEGATPGARSPFRKMVEVAGGPDGVRVVRSIDDPDSMKQERLPGHAGADANDMVWVTHVNPVKEMVDMMGATRAYEANVKAFNAAKGMARSALDIGKA